MWESAHQGSEKSVQLQLAPTLRHQVILRYNTSALTNLYRSTFFKNCRQWAFRKLSIMIWFGWIWFYNNWASIPPGPISNKLIGFCLICLKKLLSRKTSNKRKIIKNFNLDENQITSLLRPCKSFLNLFISEESRLRSCMYKLNFLTIIKTRWYLFTWFECSGSSDGLNSPAVVLAHILNCYN